MIYHFTLPGVSDPFRDAAARFERTHGVPITTVLSGRYVDAFNRRRPSPRNLVARLHEFRRRTGRLGPVVVAHDVNRYVAAHVAPGSDGVVTYFEQIFRPAAVERFATLVNFHPSILPAYKGPHPTSDAWRNGETRGGWTLHQVTSDIDGGPILDQELIDYAACTQLAEADALVAQRGVVAFERWLRHIVLGEPWETRRVDAAGVYRSAGTS